MIVSQDFGILYSVFQHLPPYFLPGIFLIVNHAFFCLLLQLSVSVCVFLKHGFYNNGIFFYHQVLFAIVYGLCFRGVVLHLQKKKKQRKKEHTISNTLKSKQNNTKMNV